MPRAYGEDLRKRVVASRQAGDGAEAIAARFCVSRDCVYRWTALERETGQLSPHYSAGRPPSIKDEEAFRAFAAAHAHSTLSQMQAAWEKEVSLMCLSRMLKRVGITHKKRHSAISSAAK